MQTIYDNNVTVSVSNVSFADLIISVGKKSVSMPDEETLFESIKIDGALAIVWMPYNLIIKVNSVAAESILFNLSG